EQIKIVSVLVKRGAASTSAIRLSCQAGKRCHLPISHNGDAMTATATTAPKTTDPRLDERYRLTDDHKRQFREDGFIRLKDVFSRDVLDEYGEEITRLTLAHAPDKPLDQRDTYGKAFIQVGNLWTMSPKA